MLWQWNNVEIFFVNRLIFSTGEKPLNPRFVEVHFCFFAGNVYFSVNLGIKCTIYTPTNLEEEKNLIILIRYLRLKTYVKPRKESGLSLKSEYCATRHPGTILSLPATMFWSKIIQNNYFFGLF